MKQLFVVFCLLPALANAQDTCVLRKSTDDFTHQTKISTGFVPFVSNGRQLSISIDATAIDVDVFLWFSKDPKCFDDQSMIQVNFDGERIKQNYRNTGSMNCEGAFHFTFKNVATTPYNLQRLVDKRISSLKITGPNKSVTDFSFTADQQVQLRRMIACVVRDSKTLLNK